jgi:hypothetical protein
MRFLSLLLVVSFVCFADAQATVKVVSKRNPGISWECLVPVANDDTTKPELGSCMPEALCDSKTGTSKWKNVFGYYHVIYFAMRILKIFNLFLDRLKDYNGVSYDYKCAFFGGKTGLTKFNTEKLDEWFSNHLPYSASCLVWMVYSCGTWRFESVIFICYCSHVAKS